MKHLFYIYIHIFLSSDVSAQGQVIARKKEEIYKIYVCRTRISISSYNQPRRIVSKLRAICDRELWVRVSARR